MRGPHLRRRRWVGLLLVWALICGGCAGSRAGSARPATDPATPVSTYDWSRSPAAALDLGGGSSVTLSAVVAPSETGADWMLAGTRLGADGTTTATVWSSSNGAVWTATALAGADGRALAATSWGSRTVIVGSVGTASSQRPAVWLSAGPGAPFTLVAADPALVPTTSPAPAGTAAVDTTGTAAMDVVAAGTQGVFAAGSISGRAAVWYSTDGSDWVDVVGAGRVVDASPGALVTTMLVTPTVVLAAGTAQAGTHTVGAVWASPDGIRWHRVSAGDAFSGDGDDRIDGLAVDPTGALLAVGAVRSGPAWVPASWVSPDGGTWSQPSEAFPTSAGPHPEQGGTVVRSVTTTATGWLAVGGSSSAQRVWTSTDGRSWAETALPAGVREASDWSADLVGTAGSTTVVVDDTPGQPRVLVGSAHGWREVPAQPSGLAAVAPVATPAALVTDRSRLLLAVDVYRPGPTLGADGSSVAVLSSTDGMGWQAVTAPGALAGDWFDSMAVISGALVAVGSSTTPTGGAAATLWTSTTGRTWSVVARLGATSPARELAATVGSLGSGIVAAGTGPGPGEATAVDAAPTAEAWSATGSGWAQADLDAIPGVGAEAVLGSCSDGPTLVEVGATSRRGIPTDASRSPGSTKATTTTVAVSGTPTGPDGQASDGTVAATWATTTGASWTAGTVSPRSGAGGGEVMDGCAALGGGFVAWGQTPGPNGEAVPALWRSPDGAAWTLLDLPTLSMPGSAPLTNLVRSGPDWVAVSGGDLAAAADPGRPGTTFDDPVVPAAAPPATSGPDGAAGVWSSSDAGTTWTRLATTGPAWAAAGVLTTQLVQLLGSVLVVAGQVDDRVAVWVGRPAPAAPKAV